MPNGWTKDTRITIAYKVVVLLLMLAVSAVSVPVAGQTKRALVVGISQYPQSDKDAWKAIHGANDAELIVSVLKLQGFSTVKISNNAATATSIRKGLEDMISSCVSGDMVYLHFSCHGQPYEDLNGDEEDGWDESIVPYDAQMVYRKGKYEGVNHIIDDELHTYFQRLRRKVGRKGFVCVVVDACHSGGASRGEDDIDEDTEDIYMRGTKKGFSQHGKQFRPRISTKGNFLIPQEARLANIVVLEACRSYQSNYEIRQSGRYYGPLSYYVSRVLSKHPLTHNMGWVLEVKKLMDADKRLTRQNMVFETSLKTSGK